MTDLDNLYESFIRKGSYLNRMIDCGCLMYNSWVERALRYLPIVVFDKHKENLAFISTSEACRIARDYCEKREIILLADRIFPKGVASEAQPEVRYFIFAVLHEVAHAIKKHKSQKFDNLSEQENQAQEHEADAIAINWFNECIKDRNNPFSRPITVNEIDHMRLKNQDQIKAELGIK
jgi:Zn-dependent peptidase ImmA (M78 family)